MRHILLLFLSFASLSLFAQEVEVPSTQQLLITKRTATWCINCGTWGWTLKTGILEDNAAEASIISAHYSGDLKTDVAESLTQNFTAFSQPRFYVGNVDQNANSGNINAKRDDIRQQVLASSEKTPTVQAGIDAAAKDQLLQVAISSKFFEAVTGEYFLGIYLVEKEVTNFQTGQTGQVIHQNVLHSALTEDWFGLPITEGGSAAVDEVKDFFFEQQLEEELLANNLMLLTVIWQKDGDTYQFVNSNTLADIPEGLLVDVDDNFELDFSIRPIPNPVTDQFGLFVANSPVSEATITVFDMLGRQQFKLADRVPMPTEAQLIPIPQFVDLKAGVYFVVVEEGDFRETVRVIKQ